MLAVTALAAVGRAMHRRRHTRRLRALADELELHYSATDRFRLSARIAIRLPVPGSAGVRVIDLLYGIEDKCYRYVFAAEYTTGVLRNKTSVRRIATFVEPRDPAVARESRPLTFAPESLPLIEQYRHLLKEHGGAAERRSD